MSWTALVPIKQANGRKSRLAGRLSLPDREALADRMFRHVIATLRSVREISDVVVLCACVPDGWSGRSVRDDGSGLNQNLAAACNLLGGRRIAILHGDLPFLSVADVCALLVAADCGYAIAPDRHQTGTNGLALLSTSDFPFAFGENSFAAHRLARAGACVVVQRTGLAVDIDTPDDLGVAHGLGMALPVPAA